MYIFKDIIKKSTKHCFQKGGGSKEKRNYKSRDEFAQSTLYTYMKLPQQNPLLIMYTNSKDNK
jgi:hypothetical protein